MLCTYCTYLRGIYQLETQRIVNRVPVNLAAKHIGLYGAVHWRDVTFQRLGFINNETQRHSGAELTGTRLANSDIVVASLVHMFL